MKPVSLIDQALADEKAFREKTAQMLDRDSLPTSAAYVRNGWPIPPVALAAIRWSAMNAKPKYQGQASILERLEALDAAHWAKSHVGR